MKKYKRLLMIFAGMILTFLISFTICLESEEIQTWVFQTGEKINTVFAAEEVVNTEGTEPDTSVVLETEVAVTEEVAEIERTYIELYGLEEVDKPEKRTEAQVMQKLAELAEDYELVREVYENADAYSALMLDHLANNPEMAAYVLGALESDGSVTGGFTEAELEEEFPLLLQFDPRWGYFEYGGKEMGLSGCGPTCLAMTLLTLTEEEDITPDQVAAYSLEHGYYVQNIGTAWKLMDDFPVLYGLSVKHPSINETNMKKELDAGNLLICSVKKGVFTAEGHFIVIYGYDETGFFVNDPKCVARSNRTWAYSEFGSQIKRIWAIGK